MKCLERLATPGAMAAVLLALLPKAALACAVCGFGQDGTSGGFISTTLLLSLSPLCMFGAIGLYLKSLAEKQRHDEFKNH